MIAIAPDIASDLELRAKAARGLSDVRAGRVVSQDEAERESARWLMHASIVDR